MKPWTNVAETRAPDGAHFRLMEHDGDYYLYMNDRQVMSTKMTLSERMLADVGCGHDAKGRSMRVLVGGLGLGFSLRRALELTGPGSVIHVAELLPEVERWNRELMGGYNDDILNDERTEILVEDVYEVIRRAAQQGPRYDAILLDVDDGPSSLLQPQNSQLYRQEGLDLLKQALTTSGRVAFWAVERDPRLFRSLKKARFWAEEFPAAKHERAKRKEHAIYLGARRT
ncbi:MAG: spermine synthase [Verrucomicrobiota bacterium JB023]|nr:spermine synthase [Verrucomicrobiota bacterium JB023]